MGVLGRREEAVATRESPVKGRVPPARGQVMDRLRELLETVTEQGHGEGNFLGLLHLLIGRRISLADETVVSAGQTWREVAALLKKVRWDREAVRELGLDPEALPPRDRQLFWFKAIAQARVDSPEAIEAGNRLGESLHPLGYRIGAAPTR